MKTKAANDSNGLTTSVTPGMAGITITFNGWAVDEWYTMKNLLNRFGAKVTFFVGNIGDLTSEEFEKLRTLKSDGHEIATQGLRYLDAVEYVRNSSLQTYIGDEITPAIEIMEENELPPTSFAYPFGSRNSTTDAELLKYFVRLRATAYASNTTRIEDLDQIYYTWQNETLIRGVGIDVEYENTIEEISAGLERARQFTEVIVLYGHTPTYEPSDFGTPVEKLEAIMQAALTLDLVFYRVSDLALSVPAHTTTTPGNNDDPIITDGIVGMNEVVISIIISCAAAGLLWLLASIVFRDEQRWASDSI